MSEFIEYSANDGTVNSVLSNDFPYNIRLVKNKGKYVFSDNEEKSINSLLNKKSTIDDKIILMIFKFCNNLARDILLSTKDHNLLDKDNKEDSKILMCIRDNLKDELIEADTQLSKAEKNIYLNKSIYGKLGKDIINKISKYLPTKGTNSELGDEESESDSDEDDDEDEKEYKYTEVLYKNYNQCKNPELLKKIEKKFNNKFKFIITPENLLIGFKQAINTSITPTIYPVKVNSLIREIWYGNIKIGGNKYIISNKYTRVDDINTIYKYILADDPILEKRINDAMTETIDRFSLDNTNDIIIKWKSTVKSEDLLDEIEDYIEEKDDQERKLRQKINDKYKYDINHSFVDLFINQTLYDSIGDMLPDGEAYTYTDAIKDLNEMLKSKYSIFEQFKDVHHELYSKGPTKHIEYKISRKYETKDIDKVYDILKKNFKTGVLTIFGEVNDIDKYSDIMKYINYEKTNLKQKRDVRIYVYQGNTCFIIFEKLSNYYNY